MNDKNLAQSAIESLRKKAEELLKKEEVQNPLSLLKDMADINEDRSTVYGLGDSIKDFTT